MLNVQRLVCKWREKWSFPRILLGYLSNYTWGGNALILSSSKWQNHSIWILRGYLELCIVFISFSRTFDANGKNGEYECIYERLLYFSSCTENGGRTMIWRMQKVFQHIFMDDWTIREHKQKSVFFHSFELQVSFERISRTWYTVFNRLTLWPIRALSLVPFVSDVTQIAEKIWH